VQPRIAILGGGISGLAAANRLSEIEPGLEVLVLEASARLGGVIQTTREREFLIEDAADNFFASPPAAVNLCRRLGLNDSLVEPDATRRQAFVVRRGQLLPVPADFQLMAPRRLGPLCSTKILSLRGKLRAGLEYFLPRGSETEDESVGSFVCRRFGRELFERLVQPLVGGIYTADPDRLSIEATLPRFRQMEREHGSLIRAMLRNRQNAQHEAGHGARYASFVALRGGMSTLIDALAARLPAANVRCNAPVENILPIDRGRWQLTLGGDCQQTLSVDGVIIATPAYQAARIVESLDREIAEELRRVEYADCAVVSLAYECSQIGQPLNGFGFVVPLVENRMILACSFSSVKYPGRAPAGTALLRVFLGGACQRELLQLPQHQLLELAEREVGELLQIRGAPLLRHVARRAMPQYHVGHLQCVAHIDARLRSFPTLALAGSALYGVGIPSCVQSAEAAAERVASSLRNAEAILRSPLSACKNTRE
jgi:oxygen-dependent protoporphyrinogen oxidase